METFVELIARKRDGGVLGGDALHRVVEGLLSGELADYQMSALLMAIYFQGLSDEETVALTQAMLHSGDVLDLSGVPGTKVDKHSTGGVGDKVSLCLAPLVAACGVPVPMVSGRGLGHTGGTLDKLEAIPGFRVDLDTQAFERILKDVGTCMIGQTARLAPADKRIYALRDVTATVECVPLIVASILSKKLAEGIDALVLDVKVGQGAFMKDLPSARRLASALARVGSAAGKRVVALLTDMSAPLGRTIGNALETREALEILQDGGPADVRACTLALGAEMLQLGGVARSEVEAKQKLEEALRTGAALRVAEKLIAAQGGDPRVALRPELLPQAEVRIPVLAPRGGYVQGIQAYELGMVSVALGAGRSRADQAVDPAVGIELGCQRGDLVHQGEPLAYLHVRDARQAEPHLARVRAAFELGEGLPTLPPLVLERIALPAA